MRGTRLSPGGAHSGPPEPPGPATSQLPPGPAPDPAALPSQQALPRETHRPADARYGPKGPHSPPLSCGLHPPARASSLRPTTAPHQDPPRPHPAYRTPIGVTPRSPSQGRPGLRPDPTRPDQTRPHTGTPPVPHRRRRVPAAPPPSSQGHLERRRRPRGPSAHVTDSRGGGGDNAPTAIGC